MPNNNSLSLQYIITKFMDNLSSHIEIGPTVQDDWEEAIRKFSKDLEEYLQEKLDA